MITDIILIESLDQYARVALLNPGSGALHVLARSQLTSGSYGPMRGLFSEIDGHQVVFYRLGAELMLRADDNVFPIRDSTSADVHREGGVLSELSARRRRFRLTEMGRPVFELSYKAEPIEPPRWLDPTPFVEDEHFDIFAFIAKILRSPERRALVFRTPDEQRHVE